MIRIFVLVGIVGGLAIAYLAVFALGPTSQLPPSESLLTGFRAQGFVPANIDLKENEEIEHDVFGVPEEDERQLEMAMKSMGDMDMGAMKMGDGDSAMKMDDGDSTMKMSDSDSAMKMDADSAPKMKLNADGSMMTNADGSMVMEGDEKTAMKMEGTDEAGHGEEKPEAGHGGEEAEGGLKIAEDGAFEREINLSMTEWGFSEMNIEVKKGERIRFNVVNDGQILHEFMIMQMAQMQAVNYRIERADWSLLEHEALYEKSLVLPGGKFSFVIEVEENGSWMFMCMLPYHMQMGMMGQMATPGMAMDM